MVVLVRIAGIRSLASRCLCSPRTARTSAAIRIEVWKVGLSGSRVSPVNRKPTAYWDYIKVEELLALQGGLEPTDAGLSNDEVLFISVHQIDEL